MTFAAPSDTQTRPLPLLADPATYVACPWDLRADADRRAYWLNLYRTHTPGLLEEAVAVEVADGHDEADARRRADRCRDTFMAHLNELERDPTKFGRLDIISIGRVRERCLRDARFADPYRLIKQRENEAALALLPALLDELDAMSADDRAAALIEGIFAGNIFDVGAVETLELFKSGKLDFHATRRKLKPRPWRIDDLDRWLGRLAAGPAYRAAVLFVDNAGCDVVLGMMPFARDLLQRGTHVILTANSTPSLNDITHAELFPLVRRIAQSDAVVAAALGDGRLEMIPSGNGTPLIDLSVVTGELAEAVTRRSVDLIVLEGMGRAVESNLDARFTCDALKIAMIKDPDVARAVGGHLYDLVLRFEPV